MTAPIPPSHALTIHVDIPTLDHLTYPQIRGVCKCGEWTRTRGTDALQTPELTTRIVENLHQIHWRSSSIHPRGTSVQPDWCTSLPLQQQSVLLLAARGPDGIAKSHPAKIIQRAYRACVLKGAYLGTEMHMEDTSRNSFMEMNYLRGTTGWTYAMREFFEQIDSLPHHYLLHLLHGAEILGYKHPDPTIRKRWLDLYIEMVMDMHLTIESEDDLDARLNDVFDEGPH